jgi:hypothetical protein
LKHRFTLSGGEKHVIYTLRQRQNASGTLYSAVKLSQAVRGDGK